MSSIFLSKNHMKAVEGPYQKRAQPSLACSKLTIKTLEQGVKYVQMFFLSCSGAFNANFEHVISSWERPFITFSEAKAA